MFTWLTMHGKDFKHHFRRLYIIFNHIESYTKLRKSCSKVIWSEWVWDVFQMFSACSKNIVGDMFEYIRDDFRHVLGNHLFKTVSPISFLKLLLPITFVRCISYYLVVFSMFTWLTTHGNDLKHHFRRLYIICNHIESYIKLPKSY